ncbi:hypothetical protein MPSEU_000720400 [Mayamaea pseudoterrestris]|nr:hypothetical protein MPSEU_000720400 [Mayamaea pseudoterrestris]
MTRRYLSAKPFPHFFDNDDGLCYHQLAITESTMIRTVAAIAISLAGILVLPVQAEVIMEASAVMEMSWSASPVKDLSTEEVYQFSREMAQFLLKSLSQDEQAASLGPDNFPFKVDVDIREQIQSNTELRQTVEAVVTCLYTSEGMQVDLDTVLMRYADPSQLPYSDAELSFRPYKEAYVLTSSAQGPTKADLGLIVATCFLTVMLVVVSAVLLHVTGGWDICHQKLSNCCFEEVDDDYPIDNKGTFQVEDAYDENDNASIETGIITATGSGVLGAQVHLNHSSTGLGVQTPARSMTEDETATPMSTSQPLGIMSMRKMHPDSPDDKGGLTNMIMNRIMPYSNK